MFGYRFTAADDVENNDELLSIDKKKRISFTKSYNKLSIIRLVENQFTKIYI